MGQEGEINKRRGITRTQATALNVMLIESFEFRPPPKTCHPHIPHQSIALIRNYHALFDSGRNFVTDKVASRFTSST